MSSPAIAVPTFEAMPLARLHAPFDDPDWIFELKYDGWRALAYLDAGRCRLVSRRGNPFKRFQALCADIARTIPRTAVLDGEITYLDSNGKPQFYELMVVQMAPTYCAFDVLWLDGRDLRSTPLHEPRRTLRSLHVRRSCTSITSRVAAWICSGRLANKPWKGSWRS